MIETIIKEHLMYFSVGVMNGFGMALLLFVVGWGIRKAWDLFHHI